jgi:hypothetical protein
MLILLTLTWVAAQRNDSSYFIAFNHWAEGIFKAGHTMEEKKI